MYLSANRSRRSTMAPESMDNVRLLSHPLPHRDPAALKGSDPRYRCVAVRLEFHLKAEMHTFRNGLQWDNTGIQATRQRFPASTRRVAPQPQPPALYPNCGTRTSGRHSQSPALTGAQWDTHPD